MVANNPLGKSIMTLGLQLHFRRELALQFPNHGNTGLDSEYLEGQIHVLGSMDYLKVKDLPRLSDVLKNETIALPESLGGASDLILISPNDDADSIDETVQSCGSENFVYLTRISISSIVFDLTTDWNGATQVLKKSLQVLDRAKQSACESLTRHSKFENISEDEFDACRMKAWFTLGGPDIVCLAFPKSARHIGLLNTYTNVLRSESSEAFFKDDFVPHREQLEGHAFSSVQSNFIYRDHPDAVTIASSSEFKSDEKVIGICYPSRMSVGPGHESAVLQRIESALGRKINHSALCMGHRSILFRFEHLCEVMEGITAASRPRIGGTTARSIEVTAVRTTVAFGRSIFECVDCNNHQVPSLSEDLTRLLKKIEEQFKRFSRENLGRSQSHELQLIFQSFKTAFCRNDKASGVRDLLPFFDQLSRAMSIKEEENWQQLFQKCDGDSISIEFSSLFRHAWRSIRNRVEHRSEPLDPAFPNTIEYGASKLVNAYTVAAWVASSVLFHDPEQSAAKCVPCGSEQFAVAVCAGNEGLVKVANSFSGLASFQRRSVVARKFGNWNAPLLLLSVSGPALFYPELAFALCIHEVAEFSNWTELPQWKTLNVSMNRWLFEMFVTLTSQRLDERTQDFSTTNTRQSDLNLKVLRLSLQLPEKKYAQSVLAPSDEPDRTSEEAERQKSLSPSDYLESLESRLSDIELIHYKRAVAMVDRANGATDDDIRRKPDDPWSKTLMAYGQGMDRDYLQVLLETHYGYQKEFLADLAMSITLMRILELKDHEELIPHLSHIFASLIEFTISSQRPNDERVVPSLLIRMSFQIACFSELDDRRSVRRNIENALDDIRPRLEKSLRTRSFDSAEVLEYCFEVNWMIFGPTANNCDLASTVAEALNESVDIWNSPDDTAIRDIAKEFQKLWFSALETPQSKSLDRRRYEFILNMWAKAQKFRISAAFEG